MQTQRGTGSARTVALFAPLQHPPDEELFEFLKRHGKAVLVISHDDRYFTVANRVLRMDYGKLA